MNEITKEMRDKLRVPLSSEAVSPHPTKIYLSSIKSIYVAERINDVFGVGSWTLKSEVIERLEKFVVVRTILEIPAYGFYGEAYGGNDNADIGDAYKGATTDGFTKIAAQQLEIGIDVFKGLQATKGVPPKLAPKPVESTKEASKAPPLKNVQELFARAAKFGLSVQDVFEAAGKRQGQIVDFDKAWRDTAYKFAATIKAAQEESK